NSCCSTADAEVPGIRPAMSRNLLMLAAARPSNNVKHMSSARSGRYISLALYTPIRTNIFRNAISIGSSMKVYPKGVNTPGKASATLPVVQVSVGSISGLSSCCATTRRLLIVSRSEHSMQDALLEKACTAAIFAVERHKVVMGAKRRPFGVRAHRHEKPSQPRRERNQA